MTRRILLDILNERERQDAQWGGADHDDTHDEADWLRYIRHQIDRWVRREADPDEVFVKIAALSVAALESMERRKER